MTVSNSIREGLRAHNDPRADGLPWRVDTTSLARALAVAARPLEPHHPSLLS
jgi:hypothetical protein